MQECYSCVLGSIELVLVLGQQLQTTREEYVPVALKYH